jgi:hypothetical protein
VSARRSSLWLRCYPPAWRARYGEELEALVAASSDGGRIPWRIRLDLLRVGSRERLRSWGLGGPEVTPGEQARAGALLVLCAWVLFVVAGAVVQRFSEHWQGVTPASDRGLAAAAYGTLVVAATLGAVLVLAGVACALPRLAAFVRAGGWGEIRTPVRRAVWLSGLATATTIALVFWAHHLNTGQRNGHDLGYQAGFAVWALVGLASLVAWTATAVTVARRIRFTDRMLKVETALAAAVSLTMLTMTIATAVWWGALAHFAPWALHERSSGPAASPITLQLITAGLLMAIATALAIAGTARAVHVLPRLAGN